MKRDYIEFQERSIALGFLITFRTYGTWLHGDERGSVDRRYTNRYGAPKIASSANRQAFERTQLKARPIVLDASMRRIVESSIKEVCEVRSYGLFALNVRTNHAHVAVSNSGKPERMMDSFKAYATKNLRLAGLIDAETKPWSRHGSTRYLWTEDHMAAAIDYVINGQGDQLPDFD